MLSKWMGHASLDVTAIYANALREEQHGSAARMREKTGSEAAENDLRALYRYGVLTFGLTVADA